MKIKFKKAQEEMVGFVFIVVIIAIVGAIILGFSIRGNNTLVQESKDIHQFLESAMELTTSCSISYEPNYLKLNELIKECNNGLSLCISGEDPCIVLNKTFNNVITKSFLVNEQANIKGYEFKSIYSTNTISKEIIIIYQGDCSYSARGAEILIPAYPGTISATLKLCYG